MTARWAKGHTLRTQATYPNGCRYCGSYRMGNADCPTCTCKACGSVQCNSYGGGHGQCGVCLVGITDGWSGHDRPCGYKGCLNRAVAEAPRVRNVCAGHMSKAIRRDYSDVSAGTVTVAAYMRARVEDRDRNRVLVDLGERRTA